MADRPYRVLLCGFGAFGAIHAAAWRRFSGVTVLIADPSGAAQTRARAHGFAPDCISGEMETFLAAADIVDIVAPPDYHLPLALEALEHGKPVLLEKPAVRSVADAITLATMAERVEIPVQVGLVLRCHPLVSRAEELLAKGAIGELLGFEGHFSGWKRMRSDSSVLENDGVHFLDLMRFLGGSPATAVRATEHRRLGGAKADSLIVELDFASGLWGLLRLGVLGGGESEDSFVPGAVTSKRLILIGREGNLTLDFNTNQLFHSRVRYAPCPGGWSPIVESIVSERLVGVTPEGLLERSMQIFLQAVSSGGPTLCGVEQGAVELAFTLEAIEAAMSVPRTPTTPVRGAA